MKVVKDYLFFNGMTQKSLFLSNCFDNRVIVIVRLCLDYILTIMYKSKELGTIRSSWAGQRFLFALLESH